MFHARMVQMGKRKPQRQAFCVTAKTLASGVVLTHIRRQV